MSASLNDLSPHDGLFLNKFSLIDVRAPIEYQAGHLPGAVNLPLMNDAERAEVGTEYKRSGSDSALALGHRLVSGANKEQKIARWRDFVQDHPDAVFYCFRGGLRSQISRAWLAEAGPPRPLILGGYKAARNFLLRRLHELVQSLEFVVVAGPTGSGKTDLIRSLGKQSLDLEALANHRGSAFGSLGPQPTQVDFENHLAVALMPKTGPVILEDESRMIGKISLPEILFEKMRDSGVVLIEEPRDRRIENIHREYVELPSLRGSPYPALAQAVEAISKKLGGVRSKEVLELLANRDSRWIGQLLDQYYDPLYEMNLRKREPRVLFRGSLQDCRQFLAQRSTNCF